MLTDAELVLGLSRHLSAYAMSPAKAAMGGIECAGQMFDMGFRLQRSGLNSPDRVRAIATEIGVNSIVLREMIQVGETLAWWTVNRDSDGAPISLNETVPAAGLLVQEAPKVLRVLGLAPAEFAVLGILRATTIRPMLQDEALNAGSVVTCAGGDPAGDSAAAEALRHLVATGLVRTVTADDGSEVAFNPNVWTGTDESLALAALRAADARATAEVTALIAEVSASPGMPQEHVTSTEQRWIDFAVSQGLIQRSIVQTAGGHERAFLFTPHLARDPFGGTAGDASGHVRQLVGSMIYAATFATHRLNSPAAFVNRLIIDGSAGNASDVGSDYPMLETAGIVRIVPGQGSGRYRMELLQSEVAEEALKVLRDRDGGGVNSNEAAALRAQRSYVHVDRERARLALSSGPDEVEQRKLIAALRQSTAGRRYDR